MIETSRLILRPVESTDLPFFKSFLSCPVSTRFLPNEGPYSPKQIASYVCNREQHWQRGFGSFMIICKSSTEYVGYVGVEESPRPGCFDLRYGVARAHAGRGFAKEAAIACIEYALGREEFNQVYGVSKENNLASVAILQKLGMTPAADTRLYDADGLLTFAISAARFYELYD
ncbi:GNAT family N-acetyltransferase [Hahella sp. KA22]|uniref:GNAT family N-acetyltransferase n=1 Tax=Hahella sp. KA22 TaxID=1628392 RepID=UPI000FDD26C0|nr:GNAT family N-acetyltransferase [Hahella sp. KA22]AZZ91261.1 N-acetyltransferase [Hahella sp. KA22]QAY54629.1 GNAT family N-acetyltransferase [Hahella sp. KA22]